ncbi:SecDF P1 head subdomain-containing protein [Parapusillimonas granuli]|uniref:SecDF P1 head subdomain domain-containing protein n=1 Tax=Parapusillimonas granuli TaxID=380911 RepID=A0A853G3V7_9BURK|nr:hypothetical protein [Parapusillimonas granuli]MBB5217218.1 preprotein translocase subunit SecD [Parapusillimonas granuli]MEB2399232.1 hypothetical protein [Alcaligenaceae bacterium]NYT50989.1 hypothetical protein [Parapusillimonas granuli]
MQTIRQLGKLIAPLSLALLAACQTTQGPGAASTASTAPAAQSAPAPAQPSATPARPDAGPAQAQGAAVAVYIADTAQQTGWTPVSLQSGTLYVNPQPIITRSDLSGVQAGSNKQGDGLLALELNEQGKGKVSDATTQNPNKRLALVVGRTLLAVPSYSTPVTTGQLIFAVGTEENATAAARAIAGVPHEEGGAAGAAAPAAR